MSEIATLVRRYVDHYNSNDVDGMLDCCVDDVIFETVVTTLSTEGVPHVAPMGIRYRGGEVVLMPYRPSTTLDNIADRKSVV